MSLMATEGRGLMLRLNETYREAVVRVARAAGADVSALVSEYDAMIDGGDPDFAAATLVLAEHNLLDPMTIDVLGTVGEA